MLRGKLVLALLLCVAAVSARAPSNSLAPLPKQPSTGVQYDVMMEAKVKAKLATLRPVVKNSPDLPGCTYPDVNAVKDLWGVTFNTAANTGYAQLARCFTTLLYSQAFDDTSPENRVYPPWHVVAPYASRMVGRGQVGLSILLGDRALGVNPRAKDEEDLQPASSSDLVMQDLDTLEAAPPQCNRMLSVWQGVKTAVKTPLAVKTFVNRPAATIAAFAWKTYQQLTALKADVMRGLESGNYLNIFKDPRYLPMQLLQAISPPKCSPLGTCCDVALRDIMCAADKKLSARLWESLKKCGSNVKEAGHIAWRFPNMLLHSLETGNRAIYLDIAGRSVNFLQWRDKRLLAAKTANGEDVVKVWCPAQGVPVQKCLAVWEKAKEFLTSKDYTNMAPMYESASSDRDEQMSLCSTVAFAAYAHARTLPNGAVKFDYIRLGNNVLAWIEQFFIVDFAFNFNDPVTGAPASGVWKIVTPAFQLTFPKTSWTCEEYVARKKLKLSELNWAIFQDRWLAILDSFDALYRSRGGAWPLPANPFAGAPML